MKKKKQEQPQYRHELKYYINRGDYEILSRRLRAALPKDPNTDDNAEYFIRSLYFDDTDDSGFRDKLDGVDNRDKFRIRTYNMQSQPMKLERKRKNAGYINKISVNITPEEYMRLAAGDHSFLLDKGSRAAAELYVDFSSRVLRPCVIVDYTREAYMYPMENVRITFDKDLRTAMRSVELLNPDVPTYPVLNIDDRDIILEVKFNGFLSSYVRGLVQVAAPERSAASKYCLCRRYEL